MGIIRRHLLESLDELPEELGRAGFPAFRTRQVVQWVCGRRTVDPDAMSNLPRNLREFLSDHYETGAPAAVKEILRSSDGTEKLLLELGDGEVIEMVLIPAPGRITACLSTQDGCPVRCRFCASGRDGLKRNLTAAEIIGELYAAGDILGKLPDNIVFMGIGEGLLNFDNLARALEFFSSPERLGISPRRITVSTSGIVPGIKRLAELGKPFNLAVSLHAPDEETRAKIIPDACRCPIDEIIAAAADYARAVNRMPTLEYTLLAGVNDAPRQAEALAGIAASIHAKINLIACNPVDDAWRRPEQRVIDNFLKILQREGAHATLRVEKGSSRNSACGQLRASRRTPTEDRS